MAADQFHCPQCKGAFEAEHKSALGRVRCPHCQEVIQLPDSADHEPPAAPSPKPPPAPRRKSTSTSLPPALDGSTGRPATATQPVDFAPASEPAEEDGDPVSFAAPVKSVGRGKKRVELTQRSQGERVSRKRRRNLVMWFACLLIIFSTMALLLLR